MESTELTVIGQVPDDMETRSAEIRLALLEQAQRNTDIVISRIVDLAQTTKDLLVSQVSRIDRQNEVTASVSNDLTEYRIEVKADLLKYREELSKSRDELHKKIKESFDEQSTILGGIKNEFTEANKTNSERITFLERWGYIISGGAVVIGFLIKFGWDYLIKTLVVVK